jgi:hypothetical protein
MERRCAVHAVRPAARAHVQPQVGCAAVLQADGAPLFFPPQLQRLKLSALHPRFEEPFVFTNALLSSVGQLQQLQMNVFDLSPAAWTNLLGVFTSDGLKGLYTLHLHSAPCTDDELVQILSHTPLLTDLELRQLSKVMSLSFFHQLPKLAETLTELTVECESSGTLTAADLQSLRVLQQLRALRLRLWPSVGAVDRLPFVLRPCIVLPHLEVFEWTPRPPRGPSGSGSDRMSTWMLT